MRRPRAHWWWLAAGLLWLGPCLAQDAPDDQSDYGEWIALACGAVVAGAAVLFARDRRRLARRRRQEAASLLSLLARADRGWEPAELQRRAREVFGRVRQAWMGREPDAVDDCLTAACLDRLREDVTTLCVQHRKNLVLHVNLERADLVGLLDYDDHTQDAFWVYFEGTALDYLVDDQSHEQLRDDSEDDPGQVTRFAKLWRFVRCTHGWLLDEMRDEPTLGELSRLPVFSQMLADPSRRAA